MKRLPSLYRFGSGSREDGGLCIGVSAVILNHDDPEGASTGEDCDIRMPMLAPSSELETAFQNGEIDWDKYSCRYRKEMNTPECHQVIQLLAVLSNSMPLALGCRCDEDNRCHRSILRDLIAEAQAASPHSTTDPRILPPEIGYSSPACFANWDDLE